MLLSVLDLEKVTVEDIMVPRNEIVGIDIEDSPAPCGAARPRSSITWTSRRALCQPVGAAAQA
jgi:CBS domain containing-hemolysin-like protein